MPVMNLWGHTAAQHQKEELEAGGEPGRPGGLWGLLTVRVMEGKARWPNQNQQGRRQGKKAGRVQGQEEL